MALLTIKSCLRNKFCLNFNKSVVIYLRGLRGRIRYESITHSDNSKSDEDLYDHELDPNTGFSSEKVNQRKKFSNYETSEVSHKYSYDKFERAQLPQLAQLDESGFNRKPYQQNYNQRERYSKDRQFRENSSFQMNDNYNHNNYNNYNNNYNNYNKNKNYPNFKQKNYQRNDYFDNKMQRNQRYDSFDKRNQYYDRRQSEEYKNFKHKNWVNQLSTEDNAIYRETKQFDYEGQRPRFSRFREQEIYENKKMKKFQRFDDNSSETSLDSIEVNDTEVEENENSNKIKEKIALPYKVTKENRFEVLNQIVIPLHLKPYEIQLNIKYRNLSEVLKKMAKKMKTANCPIVCDAKGLPCPLELVKPSPITERYRNKDEFSIWPGVDGFSKTLGFFIGQPSIHENVICVEPDNIIVSRESHLSVAKKFQNYLKDVSPYDSCQNYGEGGHWRRFHIRSNDLGHHMITAIMHPQDLTQQQLDEEMQRYRQYFEGDERITSMFFQGSRHTRLSNERQPFVHLFGDKTITETLSDKKFIISVDSFFQINTSAAHVLYRNVMSELNCSRNTTVLDICCGTGTLATLLAPNVCRVIGIDSSASAISDAQKNAALNNITNTTFIAGPVEQKLPQLMDELYSEDIVVVANPTRAGLHSSVINALREIKFIRKVVYVSCKPEGNSFKNFIHLCIPSNRQNNHLGSSFLPTNAIPVDLFPHTNHCELILTFERF